MASQTDHDIPTGSPSSMSDAQWRTYITAVCAGLDNMGFSRTSDTGQFDPDTVARPTTSTYIYEMRKLQVGSDKVVAKIEYNSTTIRLRIATSSDGSGSLSGSLSSSYESATLPSVNTGGKLYFAGGSDYITLSIRNGSTVYGFSGGLVDGFGSFYLYPYGYRLAQLQVENKTGPGYFSPGLPANPPDPNNAPIFRLFTYSDAALPQEVPFAVIVINTAGIAFSTFQATVYGELATWRILPQPFYYVYSTNLDKYVICVRAD